MNGPDRQGVAAPAIRRIYLDYNASTPIAPEVAALMRELMDGPFGNPSSLHWAGAPAREIVATARRKLADLLGCASGEVVFTSAGRASGDHGALPVSRTARSTDHLAAG
jgi:cysteine desulfurase